MTRQLITICRILLFLCTFTLGPIHLRAQQLSIGQIPFRLGMTMNEAKAMTHDPIYLDDLGNTSATAMWIVREKHGENNFVLIGSIIFRNGMAETLRRDLRSFSTKDSYDVGNALFKALEGLRRSDPSVGINTDEKFISSESGGLKEVIIGTGQRRIEIQIPEAGKADMVITEVLTLAKP